MTSVGSIFGVSYCSSTGVVHATPGEIQTWIQKETPVGEVCSTYEGNVPVYPLQYISVDKQIYAEGRILPASEPPK